MPILNEDWDGEEVWSIDDPRVPQSIRDHGSCFESPARHVIEVNPGEYLLYDANGDLLDLCYLGE